MILEQTTMKNKVKINEGCGDISDRGDVIKGDVLQDNCFAFVIEFIIQIRCNPDS